nr:MAG TPA: hypothetical protein [Caudoviricetes sp.]
MSAPDAPPSFYLSVFAQVREPSGAFPPSSAIHPRDPLRSRGFPFVCNVFGLWVLKPIYTDWYAWGR